MLVSLVFMIRKMSWEGSPCMVCRLRSRPSLLYKVQPRSWFSRDQVVGAEAGPQARGLQWGWAYSHHPFWSAKPGIGGWTQAAQAPRPGIVSGVLEASTMVRRNDSGSQNSQELLTLCPSAQKPPGVR